MAHPCTSASTQFLHYVFFFLLLLFNLSRYNLKFTQETIYHVRTETYFRRFSKSLQTFENCIFMQMQ